MYKFNSLLTNPQLGRSDYRPDVDGLRAVAVLSVIIYHINPNLVTGGFTGVDIFFVISGYLITSHLLNEIVDRKTFSIFGFYERRVRRIIPALFVMVSLTLAFGYIYLTDFYFNNLANEALSSLLSFSNIYFYLNTGYFDLDSSMRPLLHTWSLGVEEQFYLVWPVLILTIFKVSQKPAAIAAVLFTIAIVSFLLNFVFADDVNALFYLMPFRVFELAGGGLIAWLHFSKISIPVFEKNRKAKEVLSLIGLTLLIAPLFYLDDGVIFPSYNVIPTLAGCMILIYCRNTFVSAVLSNRIIVFIGLLSYSLYLYHWPIIFYTNYFDFDLNNFEYALTVSVLTLMLALISYHFVEKPFRHIKQGLLPRILMVSFVATVAVSLATLSGGIHSFNSSNELIGSSENRSYFRDSSGCEITTADKSGNCDWKAEKQLLFLGNSHNLDGYNIFSYLYSDNPGYNFIFGGNSNPNYCAYQYVEESSAFSSKNGKCAFGAKKLSSKKFVENIDVVIVSYFKLRDMGIFHRKQILELTRLNPKIKVFIVGGFIGLRPDRCENLINKTGNLDACKDDRYVTYWGDNEFDWIKKQPYYKVGNIHYIDRVKLLCGQDKKLEQCKVRDGKDLFFYDGDHFSLTGAKYVAEQLREHYKVELGEFGLGP
jgi:peptidoglycan/LPS O-acetylase OafA/YrhL